VKKILIYAFAVTAISLISGLVGMHAKADFFALENPEYREAVCNEVNADIIAFESQKRKMDTDTAVGYFPPQKRLEWVEAYAVTVGIIEALQKQRLENCGQRF
jgi:hypothetical protein